MGGYRIHENDGIKRSVDYNRGDDSPSTRGLERLPQVVTLNYNYETKTGVKTS